MNDRSVSKPRRGAMFWLLGGSLAAVIAPALTIVGRYLAPPRGEPASTVVGDAAETEALEGRVVKVGMKDAVLLKRDDGSLRAVNVRCTHAGCNVVWRPDEGEFRCPCHGGVFDRAGRVIDGPPQQPLSELRVEMQEGRVIVTDEEA